MPDEVDKQTADKEAVTLRYAEGCRIAAEAYQRKADDNRAHSDVMFDKTGEPLWRAQARAAAALRALAALCERAETMSGREDWDTDEDADEALDLRDLIAAGYREGRDA